MIVSQSPRARRDRLNRPFKPLQSSSEDLNLNLQASLPSLDRNRLSTTQKAINPPQSRRPSGAPIPRLRTKKPLENLQKAGRCGN